MKKTLKLSFVLLRNFEMGAFEKKKSKTFYLVMAILTLAIIMIPAAFMFGVISYGMTATLIEQNELNQGVNFLLYAISLFSFIFCLNVVLNVFYFAGDIDCLLPMPLKGEQIIGAKFIASLISENAMQFILVISSLLGYIIIADLPLYSFFYLIIAILTIPILPLVYCSIICMLFMAFTKFVKNSDTVNKISSSLIIVVTIVLLVLVVFLTNSNIDNFTIGLVDSKFMSVMNVIFPSINFLTSSMNGNFLHLIYYLLINIGALVLFIVCAKFFYFKGVNRRINIKTKKKEIAYKERKPLRSCLNKEIKLLFKTPAFFANCIIINFIWPFFVFLLLFLYDKSGKYEVLLNKYYANDTFTHIIFFLGIIAVSIIITATNSIASSSLSREGKNFYTIKSIPVKYSTQLNAKALSSILISGICLIAYIIIFGIIVKISLINIFLYILASILAVIFISYLGLFLDTVNPKLVWDDEMNALRGNHNVFINMAFSIIISAVLIFLIYGLYLLKLNIILLFALAFVLLVIFAYSAYKIALTKGVKNIERIE